MDTVVLERGSRTQASLCSRIKIDTPSATFARGSTLYFRIAVRNSNSGSVSAAGALSTDNTHYILFMRGIRHRLHVWCSFAISERPQNGTTLNSVVFELHVYRLPFEWVYFYVSDQKLASSLDICRGKWKLHYLTYLNLLEYFSTYC